MCDGFCMTSCGCSGGSGACGFCSECVSCAACNNMFCGSCTTGAADATACTPSENQTTVSCCGSLIPPTETPLPGSCAGICSSPDVSTCLPFAGTDSSGNDIYQKACGGLVYSDGSSAARADITCNCGACMGTPCSPRKCGTTDQPPKGSCSGKAPQGGGSGGGSAGSSTGSAKPKPHCSGSKQASALSSAMGRFGSAISSLLGGGQKVGTNQVLPGQPIKANQSTPMSSNTYGLIIVIVGILLLVMAFGHKPTGD